MADADRIRKGGRGLSREGERAEGGREIQFQSPVSLVTLIAMNRLENITYGGGKKQRPSG